MFAHHYRDTRGVAARPDNTGRRARRVDVSVQTLGGSLEWEGPADVRVWAAGQRGRWFGDAHRAFSASIEGGYRWSSVRWKPQARAGFLWASGDDDPGDAVHGTFFPMVPTARPDLAAGLFAPMNLRHASAHLSLQPHPAVAVSLDAHRLALAQSLDGWYGGTGATAGRGEYFGYSTRPSRLATGLGTLATLSADAKLSLHWSLKTSAGLMKGGEVIRRQFDGSTMWMLSVETRFRIP